MLMINNSNFEKGQLDLAVNAIDMKVINNY